MKLFGWLRRRKPSSPLICQLCHRPYQAGSFYVCAGCLNSSDEVGIALNEALRRGDVHA